VVVLIGLIAPLVRKPRAGPGDVPGEREYGDVWWWCCRRYGTPTADMGEVETAGLCGAGRAAAVEGVDVGCCDGDVDKLLGDWMGMEEDDIGCVAVVMLDVAVELELLEASVEAAAAFWALEREAPLTPPVGEVLAVWNPERTRKAERMLAKKGRLVDMMCGFETSCWYRQTDRRRS
jgi:hypothetical protein